MAPGHKLPAWYYRLVALTIKEERDVESEDFDEDISDIDRTPDPSESECDCEPGEDCECDYPASPSSERSYNGSDADYYYELKDQREERKQDLREMKMQEREEKERVRKAESIKEEEVKAAYKSVQQAESKGQPLPPLDSIARKNFRLYSVDHVDHRYDSIYPSKYVEFYYFEEGTCKAIQPPSRETKIQGHLYLNVESGCDFDDFSPPKQAGLKKYSLKDITGKFAPTFQFLSNDHLIVTVPRDIVFKDVPGHPKDLAPETFTFYGIRYDFKEEKRQREEKRKRKRSSSPGDTWFERSHPMGAWNSW
ncbi:hypothetical protein J3E69DRAFT_380914 [Trichoderma sp. SZMC 28015]